MFVKNNGYPTRISNVCHGMYMEDGHLLQAATPQQLDTKLLFIVNRLS